MKILNLYCGIGGNRKLWGEDHEITAVEYKQEIADIYHDFFPNDKIVVADAHQYLLDHYKEFDFIWSSPPCPSHSRLNKTNGVGLTEKKYPEMSLYQEIIFLQNWFKGVYCVENVLSYYDPLIPPQNIEKHYWWANFLIASFKTGEDRGHNNRVNGLEKRKGFNLSEYNGIDKKKALRNCVEPELGKHILDCSLGLQRQQTLI